MKETSNHNTNSIERNGHFLTGGGEMGELIRLKNWSKTPLGAIKDWPQSLRTSVSLCLNSRFPILIWWGKDLVKIYNDAYRPILGSKHPALGVKGQEVWPEIWHLIGPMLESVLEKGEATWSEDQLLLMARDGYLEETYFTFSYSPIYDESGNVAGVFTAVTETTDKVVGERHLTTLKDLGSYISGNSEQNIYKKVAKVFDKNQCDIPFSLIYKIKDQGSIAKRIAKSGISAKHPAAPSTINFEEDDNLWDLYPVVKNSYYTVVDDLSERFNDLPLGAWNEPPKQALIMPITQSGRTHPYGILIVGLNPHQLLDKKYISFFKLLADQIGGEVANAKSYEEAQKQAEALAEVDKAKTVFFSNISHEFRSPLTLILGPLEDVILQKDKKISQDFWENIGTSYHNAKRLMKLVNMLLDFSSIEAGKMQASYQLTDISQLTADLASSFRSSIENVGLKLEINCEEIDLPVYVDKEMWEKIVLNLLSNAYKYTLEGKIEVFLTQEGNYARLKVKDTGVGIPKKELKHIFQRFHRAKNISGRPYQGSGIGLALVNELVKFHQGAISVESIEGKGSEFVVDIPLGKAHLPQDSTSDELIEETTANNLYLNETDLLDRSNSEVIDMQSNGLKENAARVLVVEDNEDMSEYIARLLGKHYIIETATDIKAALERIKNYHFDLIISDIMMPGINGLEFVKLLKSDNKTALIPTILLSALAGEGAKIKGYETGADDYLIKPFSSRELLSRVRAHLKMAQTRKHYELQMRNIFNQAYVAICILRGPEHIIEFANAQMVNFWGRSLEEAINKPVLEVFPEIIEQGFKKILHDVYKNGERYVAHEFPIKLLRNGAYETVYLHLVYEPLREEDGTISGIIAVANDVTEHVHSKNVAQESEKRFRDLVMQSPIAMGVFKGKDMIVDLVNESMLKLWKKENSEVQGKKHINIVPEVIDQGFPEKMKEVYETGTPLKVEGAQVLIKTKEEKQVRYFINCNYVPLFEPDGKTVSGIIATVVDVTEQAEAKKKIEESESRYRQLVQGLPSPLYTCDAEGRIELYNGAAAKLWGREPVLYEDMWCGSWRIYETDGTPLPLDECPMAVTLKEGIPMSGEIIIERPDGEKRYVQANAQPIFGADGKLTGALNMLIDITKSKHAENLLRESEERFRKVADTAPAMIWMTDVNRYTYFFNSAWLKFTGKTIEEEKGRGWEEGVHPDDLQRSKRISGEAFENNKQYYMEYRLKRADGEYRWLAESAVPRFTSEDVFEGYIGSCMDIHDRRTASEMLEKRVEQRTKELRKANEELEKINQELTSFAYISSHDLQEPLRKIQTFISRIVDIEHENLSNKGRDYFERIQNASKRMQQLIEDLLAYSRTNTDEKNLERIDLNELINEVKYELQEKIEEQGADIEVAPLPVMNVIKFQFHQLFTNLLSNAIKFSREGVKPKIVVAANKVKGHDIKAKGIYNKETDYYHISVNDNGIGFEQQYSHRIFELFQRLHGRTEYRGTGIGLAICKKIVENHGGVIMAEGNPGEGTTFHVYLPVEDQEAKKIGEENNKLAKNKL